MRHIKYGLSVLLVLALIVCVVPAVFATNADYQVSTGETVVIELEFNNMYGFDSTITYTNGSNVSALAFDDSGVGMFGSCNNNHPSI